MYWPTAIVTNSPKEKPYTMFTSEGTFNIEESKKVISNWKNEYKEVLCAYICDDSQNVVYLENNVDSFGHVYYSTYNEIGFKDIQNEEKQVKRKIKKINNTRTTR